MVTESEYRERKGYGENEALTPAGAAEKKLVDKALSNDGEISGKEASKIVDIVNRVNQSANSGGGGGGTSRTEYLLSRLGFKDGKVTFKGETDLKPNVSGFQYKHKFVGIGENSAIIRTKDIPMETLRKIAQKAQNSEGENETYEGSKSNVEISEENTTTNLSNGDTNNTNMIGNDSPDGQVSVTGTGNNSEGINMGKWANKGGIKGVLNPFLEKMKKMEEVLPIIAISIMVSLIAIYQRFKQ